MEVIFPANRCRADSRLVPSQWETSLLSNAVSHWLGANLESANRWQTTSQWETSLQSNTVSHWLDANLESANRWHTSAIICLKRLQYLEPHRSVSPGSAQYARLSGLNRSWYLWCDTHDTMMWNPLPILLIGFHKKRKEKGCFLSLFTFSGNGMVLT